MKQRLKPFPKTTGPIPAASFNNDGTLYAYAASYDWHKGVEHYNNTTAKHSVSLHFLFYFELFYYFILVFCILLFLNGDRYTFTLWQMQRSDQDNVVHKRVRRKPVRIYIILIANCVIRYSLENEYRSVNLNNIHNKIIKTNRLAY